MTDLIQAIAEVKLAYADCGTLNVNGIAAQIVLDAAASDELIPLSDRKLAVADAFRRALGAIADLPTPLHEETKCGHEDAYRAVAALADTDDLAEVQKLWAIGASVNQHLLDKLDAEARAEAAEAELHESEGNLAHALHQLDQAKAELASTQAKLAGVVEALARIQKGDSNERTDQTYK